MDWQRDLIGLAVGFVLATVTTPVGVSGAVFLLPVQMSVLHVPEPAEHADQPALQRDLRAGRAAALPPRPPGGPRPGQAAAHRLGARGRARRGDPRVRRLPTRTCSGCSPRRCSRRSGCSSCASRARRRRGGTCRHEPSPRWPSRSGSSAGVYGIGGGSVMGPILVGTGMAVATVGARGTALHLGHVDSGRRDVRRDLAGRDRTRVAGLVAGHRLRPRRPRGRVARRVLAAADPRARAAHPAGRPRARPRRPLPRRGRRLVSGSAKKCRNPRLAGETAATTMSRPDASRWG